MSLSEVLARSTSAPTRVLVRDWGLLALAVLAATVAVAVDVANRTFGGSGATVSRVAATCFALAAGASLCAALLDRSRRDPARRRPMRALALAGALLWGGQAVGYAATAFTAGGYDERTEVIPLLVVFPLSAYAVLTMSRPGHLSRANLRIAVLDSVVAVLSLAVIWWQAVVPSWASQEPWQRVDQVVMYSALSVVAVLMILSRRAGSLPFVQEVLLVAGLVVYLSSDAVAQFVPGADDTSAVSYAILGYVGGAAFLVAFAHRSGAEPETAAGVRGREQLSALTPVVLALLAGVVVVRSTTVSMTGLQLVVSATLLLALLGSMLLARATAAHELWRNRVEAAESLLANRTREGWFRALIGDSADGVLVVDGIGTIVYTSPRAEAMFGCPDCLDPEGPSSLADLLPEVGAGEVRLLLAQVSQDPGLAGPYDLLACGHDGRELEVELTVRPLSDVEFEGYVVTARDVTDSRRIARQLANSRRRDDLTGLLTREAFLAELSDRFERRRGGPFAVVVVDLERFAALNDGMGHETGDLILTAVARSFERLPDAVRATARLGSDDFAWIVDAHEAPPAVGEAVERCARELRGLLLPDGREVEVGLRAGYVLVDPEHPRPLGWYLEAADMALKRAKATRHSHLVAYESDMKVEVERRISAERRLRRALADGRLEVHYQPVVGLADMVVHGAEALVRLRDEDGTLVLPDEFVPLAEELGLIHDLGNQVLSTACRQTAEAGRRVGQPMRVAVNVAADQLRPELVAEVAEALSSSGLDPDLLTLELTESTLADQSAVTAQVLVDIRALGVWVSLDDFGTGYSSMSYLARLPVAGLKIDRSFVSVLGTSVHGLTLARMVVQLAGSLGLSTVAEGIETVEQADLLRGMGCDYGQGYLYARPMPFEDYVEYLRGSAALPLDA